MDEYDKDLTLEEAIESYGKTRGLAAYITVQAIEHLEQPTSNYETLEGVLYEILVNYIDE